MCLREYFQSLSHTLRRLRLWAVLLPASRGVNPGELASLFWSHHFINALTQHKHFIGQTSSICNKLYLATMVTLTKHFTCFIFLQQDTAKYVKTSLDPYNTKHQKSQVWLVQTHSAAEHQTQHKNTASSALQQVVWIKTLTLNQQRICGTLSSAWSTEENLHKGEQC